MEVDNDAYDCMIHYVVCLIVPFVNLYLIFQEDPLLENYRNDLITICARKLDKAKMIRFEETTKFLYPTNLGRTASNYYIDFATIEVGNFNILKRLKNDVKKWRRFLSLKFLNLDIFSTMW